MVEGLLQYHEVKKYSQLDRGIIRKHVRKELLIPTGYDKHNQYTFHPEDVRDYVYYTLGRLDRLKETQ